MFESLVHKYTYIQKIQEVLIYFILYVASLQTCPSDHLPKIKRVPGHGLLVRWVTGQCKSSAIVYTHLATGDGRTYPLSPKNRHFFIGRTLRILGKGQYRVCISLVDCPVPAAECVTCREGVEVI